MEDRLKPCPFCGGEAKAYDGQVVCVSCWSGSACENTTKEAIDKWNTRKPMDRIVEQFESLPYKEHSVMRESKEVPEYFETVKTYRLIRLDKVIKIVKAVQNENET